MRIALDRDGALEGGLEQKVQKGPLNLRGLWRILQALIARCLGSVVRKILTSDLPLASLLMLPEDCLRSGDRSTEFILRSTP
jgi:hypothetical protein